MLTLREIDQLVSLTLADLKILTPEEYRAMSAEAKRQRLAETRTFFIGDTPVKALHNPRLAPDELTITNYEKPLYQYREPNV